jgi:hypothetical protein
LHINNSFLKLELGYVPNSTTCSTNFTVELLRGGVGRAELKNRSRVVSNTPLVTIDFGVQ